MLQPQYTGSGPDPGTSPGPDQIIGCCFVDKGHVHKEENQKKRRRRLSQMQKNITINITNSIQFFGDDFPSNQQ